MSDHRAMMGDRRTFLRTVGMGAAALACAPASLFAVGSRRPSVVVILTDDQGYADLGCYGATGWTTPNIDRMASEGVRFTDFHVSEAVCSASRASLLTGCYAQRIGIRGALMPASTAGLSEAEETIASMLKNEGYATGIFGKWHLGHHREFLPLQHGFDEFFGLPYSNDMWPVDFDGEPITDGAKSAYPPLRFYEGNEPGDVVRTLADQDSLTGVYTRRAVRFIEENRSRPFFLYLPHSMPHVPLGVSSRFRGASAQGKYGDVIMELDWSVGEILGALTRLGIADHTFVVFVSDNGPWLNFGNHAGSAGALREGKGTMWEGGARVPCIIRWPGHCSRGSTSRQLAATMDLLPTIAAACGARLPSFPIDGVNILPLLSGDPAVAPRDDLYYYYDGELQAVRKRQWKLHFPHSYRSYAGVAPGNDGHPGTYGSGKTGFELYDLDADPGEQHDLAAEHPGIVAELTILGDDARKELGDRLTGAEGSGNRAPGRVGAKRAGRVASLAAGGAITLAAPPSQRYAGKGPATLIDGSKGSLDHGDGMWLGFEGDDLEAVIDLGLSRPVRRITCSFLENQAAWIFPPVAVDIEVSADGKKYAAAGHHEDRRTSFDRTLRALEIGCSLPGTGSIRYIRVKAKSAGTCPGWHPGAGGKAWLFADEIIVD
jgi:arylsulfatase